MGIVAKNKQKITYDGEFSIVKSTGLKYTHFFKKALNLTLFA